MNFQKVKLAYFGIATRFSSPAPGKGAGGVPLLSEGIERAAEKQKSQCLQGFPRFCRLAGRERDTPGLLPRVFCPLGRDKERRQVRRLFDAEMAARRRRGVTMVYINRENHEFDDLNRNFRKMKIRKISKIL